MVYHLDILLLSMGLAGMAAATPVPPCPTGDGFLPLSNYYPAQTVWFADDQGETSRVAEAVREALPHLKVALLPAYRSEDRPAVVWLQDVVEFGIAGRTGAPAFIGYPYQGKSHWQNLLQQSYGIEPYALPHLPATRGNHGGNIEALTDRHILVGDTATPGMLDWWRTQGLHPVKVKTSWLNVGHVDELFLILPGRSAGCPRVGYASPRLALELLHQDAMSKTFCVTEAAPSLKTIGIRSRSDCLATQKFTAVYEEMMQGAAEQVRQAVPCAELLPIPVAFFPEDFRGPYGLGTDRARSVDANPVNALVARPHVVLPQQSQPAYAQYIDQHLGQWKLQTHYVASRQTHWNGGNLHCLSGVSRQCRPLRSAALRE